MKIQLTVFALIMICFAGGCKKEKDPNFVSVANTGFVLNNEPYYFLGTNFWYGLNLGSKGPGGDRDRLKRELDRLKEMGVTNLRVVAGSEGPDSEPYRMVPALQTAPGKYNEEVLDGLDYLLNEMKSRDMRAVMCMANFWNWSGGFGQYIVWSGGADSIPYPPPQPGGDWNRYQEFAASFYSKPEAVKMLNDHITFIVNRTNTYSKIAYKDDPTIMAWQLCNEPRGLKNIADYTKWIENTTGMIRKLDSNHLITIGSEGKTSSPYSGTNPELDHSFSSVDYMTMHLWVQNWGIYDPAKPDSTYETSVAYAERYITEHEEIAARLNKPLVMEEFGISRDGNSHDFSSTVEIRDKYYRTIFDKIHTHASTQKSVIAGCNFWAWGGEGRPREPECMWKAGDNFIGDPPHETQGWYSVFDTDTTTIEVIKAYTFRMRMIGKTIKQ